MPLSESYHMVVQEGDQKVVVQATFKDQAVEITVQGDGQKPVSAYLSLGVALAMASVITALTSGAARACAAMIGLVFLDGMDVI